MKRAVGYIRRSTDKQEQSLEDQQRSIEKYAENSGYKLVRFYKDDAISGVFTNSRIGFKEMIETASNSNRDFDYILVWDIKRFSRGDSDEAGYYRHLLRQNEVEVIYISENFRGDDSDDLVLGTKQWLARQESKDKSKDAIRGQLSRILKGLSSSGHPYAYYRQIIDKDGKIIQVCNRGEKSRATNEEYTKLIPGDPKEIKVVRRIFDAYANKGMGYRLIARMLNQDHILSPRGKVWGSCAINFILLNQIYMGNLVYNKSSKAKFHRIVKTERGYEAKYKGKVANVKSERYKDKEQWIVIDSAVEPIITKELFNKAMIARQQRITNKSFSGRATTSNFLWTGIVRCKYCGRSMYGTQQKSGNNKYPYYICPGCSERGERNISRVSAKDLDSLLLARIKERFFNSNRLQNTLLAIKEKLSEKKGDPKLDLIDIEKKLNENKEKSDNLLDLIDSNHKDLIISKLDKIRDENERLFLEKEKLSVTKVNFNVDVLAKEILNYANDFDVVLQQGSPSERKEIVRSFIGQIIIDSEKRHAKVGFYSLPKILATEPILYGYAMNMERCTN